MKFICESCRKEFNAYASKNRLRKYCSLKCRVPAMLGKHHSNKSKIKIGLGHKGLKYGKQSKSHRKKIAERRREWFKNPKNRKTLSIALKKSPFTKGKYKGVWKGGRNKNSRGYIEIYSPNHPFVRESTPYIAEHRLIMEKHLKRYLTPNEVVHHINGIRNDNRIENLVLLKTMSEHTILHNKQRHEVENGGVK